MNIMQLKYWVILLGVVIIVSLGFSLPHLFIPHLLDSNDKYHPLFPVTDGSMQAIDQVHIYAVKAQAILNGRFFFDHGIYENRQKLSPFISELIPSLSLAILAKIGNSLESGFILGNIVFPPICFLLFFLLLWKETHRFLISLAGASFSLLADPMMRWVFFPQRIIHQLLYFENWQSLLPLTRQFNPGTVLPVWLAFIISYALYLKKPSRFLAMITWIFGGLTAYNYPIYLLTTIIGVFIFNVYLLVSKKFSVLMSSIKIWLTVIVAWIPWALVIFFAGGAEANLAHIDKFGETPSPWFHISQLTRYFVFLPLFIFYPRKKTLVFSFIFSLFVASILIYLAPIVGLFKMANDHFLSRATSYLASPLLFLSLSDLIYHKRDAYLFRCRYIFLMLTFVLLPWREFHIIASIIVAFGVVSTFLFIPPLIIKFLATPLLIVILFASIIHPLWIHYQVSQNLASQFTFSRDQKDLVNWISTVTQPQSVIGTLDLEDSLWLQAHTGRYLFYPRLWLTSQSIEQLEDRFLILNKTFGVSDSQLIFPNRSDLSSMVTQSGLNINKWLSWYGYGFRYHSDIKKEFNIPPIEKERITQRYLTENLTDGCNNPYRLDYLLVGSYTKANLDTNIRDCWKIVFGNESYSIYSH